MTELRRILAATDFSAHSARALDYAIALAKQTGARVDLIHCYHLPVQVVTPEQVIVPRDFWSGVRDAAAAKLKEVEARTRAAGVAGESQLSEMPAAMAVVERARESGADLIAIGTRGLTGLKHVVLGSVAERVLRTAPCPVLTLHEGTAVPADGRLEKVVVPMDFSEPARAALAFARDLASKLGPAHLILAHAFHVPPEIEALGIPAPEPMLVDLRERAEKDLEEMLVALQDAGVSAEYVARRGTADHVICDLAEEKGANLIAMGTHGRTGLAHVLLGSVAERVVREAPCAVLTVKP